MVAAVPVAVRALAGQAVVVPGAAVGAAPAVVVTVVVVVVTVVVEVAAEAAVRKPVHVTGTARRESRRFFWGRLGWGR